MKKENKFIRWFKKFGVVAMAAIAIVVIALVVTFNVEPVVDEKPTEPVSTDVVEFGLPMQDAVVVKDYANDHLQFNESLNRWEIHLAVDLASENQNVLSVCDGHVTKIDFNSLDGYTIEVGHADGFTSVYGSLDSTINLQVGDAVKKGQTIGAISTTATNESAEGSHLHFVLLRNGTEVDPNNYLDLQNK